MLSKRLGVRIFRWHPSSSRKVPFPGPHPPMVINLSAALFQRQDMLDLPCLAERDLAVPRLEALAPDHRLTERAH